MVLLKAPFAVGIAIVAVLAAWMAIMLVAYVTSSASLMRASLWGIGVVAVSPFAMVILTILLSP